MDVSLNVPTDLPDLSDKIVEKTDNKALSGALKRIQNRAQQVHNSHYTKHGSHSVKHSSGLW